MMALEPTPMEAAPKALVSFRTVRYDSGVTALQVTTLTGSQQEAEEFARWVRGLIEKGAKNGKA